MRVYISVDMEGVAGVVHESQTDPTNPACAAEYGRFRRLMTAEANATIEGALTAGATKVVVNDSHWFMRNRGAAPGGGARVRGPEAALHGRAMLNLSGVV